MATVTASKGTNDDFPGDDNLWGGGGEEGDQGRPEAASGGQENVLFPSRVAGCPRVHFTPLLTLQALKVLLSCKGFTKCKRMCALNSNNQP